ncbi:MAG: PD-(D/E)XK nuclease family protein, partial [Deltaproteobacteria bacterium]|nr:PD-(D/E)XK nuclease family protein [Deltaproteobacteria bacterium]
MTRGATRESVSGVVIRVSTEPKTAPRGGYLFRGLEISGNMGNDRIFVIFPAFLGRDLYEFPLLCWEGAQVAAFDVELNNRLRDGTVIYHATQESEVLLEPHRPVSITDAVQAVECIRSVDVRFRVGSGEPFWMAKGKLVHTLFDHLVHDRGTSPERMFEEAFRLALTALKEILPGSRVSFTEEQLESQARDHFNNLLSWWAEMRDRTLHTEVEVDRISSRWGLKGRADAVLHAKDRTAIVELKTGRVALEGHMLQLLAYSLLFSKDEGDTLPEAYLFYSANGKAEKLDSTRAYPRRAILEGRNLVVALKRSYSFPKDPVPEPLAIGPCGQRGRCLFKRDCYRLFGSSQGRRPILVGREREYYDRWFGLLSRDIWSVEEELARILNSATLS